MNGYIINKNIMVSAVHNKRQVDIVTRDLTEEKEFLLVRIIIKYYNDNAQMGEKLDVLEKLNN